MCRCEGKPVSPIDPRVHETTTRISELPALNLSQRYTGDGGTAAETGPLRVTVHYHNRPVSRAPTSSLRRYTRSYTDNVTTTTPPGEVGRTVRRVRFDLPPKPPPPSPPFAVLPSSASGVKPLQHKQTAAGVESWLRNRAGLYIPFLLFYQSCQHWNKLYL
ncbi:hypothetical protein C0J52_14772 [Blattella germanica]|nr:hypothetical protein C0J52_14772 [Blattella germanica]